ncbi:MAG: hypothetical protein OXK76_16345 [Gammaproteobacteria bacterium]|nr:hypothetical protein [Gammaproteobacteria bacterium]
MPGCDGSIAVNAERGWLHNVGGAAFVVLPDAYEAGAGRGDGEDCSATIKVRTQRQSR